MPSGSFDRMRDLVLVSAGTNLPVGATALLIAVLVDVPGDWDNYLAGMATVVVIGAGLLAYLWWSLRRLKNRAPLPGDASVRTQREILAGSIKGLLLWVAVAVGFTLLFGTFMAGVAAGAAVIGPFFLLPIAMAERRESCEILIAAERSSKRSEAATSYWTRPA